MSDWNPDDLARWLEAEREEAFEEADLLFARVAKAHLLTAEVPAGLTTRVIAAIPVRAKATGLVLTWAASWWGRLSITACLVTLGVAFAVSSPRSLVEFAVHSAASLASLAGLAVSAGAAALHLGDATWTLLGSLGRAAAAVATTAPFVTVVVANLCLASAAFFGLKRLLAPRQEYS